MIIDFKRWHYVDWTPNQGQMPMPFVSTPSKGSKAGLQGATYAACLMKADPAVKVSKVGALALREGQGSVFQEFVVAMEAADFPSEARRVREINMHFCGLLDVSAPTLKRRMVKESGDPISLSEAGQGFQWGDEALLRVHGKHSCADRVLVVPGEYEAAKAGTHSGGLSLWEYPILDAAHLLLDSLGAYYTDTTSCLKECLGEDSCYVEAFRKGWMSID